MNEVQNERLKALRQWEPDVNIEQALVFCGGSEDFYVELLQDFYDEDKQQELETLFLQQDWKKYTVVIHGLKGLSRTLGFMELGDMAEQLQMASETENMDVLQECHPRMMERYGRVLEGIRNM